MYYKNDTSVLVIQNSLWDLQALAFQAWLSSAGRFMVNTVPCPTSLSIEIVPLCFSMTTLTKFKPSPAPFSPLISVCR